MPESPNLKMWIHSVAVRFFTFQMKVTMSSNVTCDSNPVLENIDDRSTACAYKVILYIGHEHIIYVTDETLRVVLISKNLI